MARIIINRINFSNKINGALTSKRFGGIVGNAAQARFDFRKDELLKDFDDSEITKELQAGAKATSSVLSYGNLASFVGLSDSNRSVAELRLYLQSKVRFNHKDQTPIFKKTRDGAVFEYKVNSPTLQEIYDAFPAESTYSKSWIQIIHDGYGTFSYYVFRLLGFNSANSISGTGLQRPTKRKWMKVPDSSPKFKWINQILLNFKNQFKK